MEKILREFVNDEHFQNIQKEYPNIADRMASLRLTNVKRRNFYHWKEEGLIDWGNTEEDDKRTWVRLNIYEFIWVRIIQSARDFGIPIDSLRELKDFLFSDFTQLAADQIDTLEDELINQFNYSPYRAAKHVELVKYVLSHEKELRESGELLTLSMLGIYIHGCLLFDRLTAIVFTKENVKYEFSIYMPDDPLTSELFSTNDLLSKSHVYIHINHLVEEFMGVFDNLPNLNYWGFITTKEMKLIFAIRSGEYDSIHIKGMNNEDFIIEGTKTEDVKLEQAARLQKIFGMKMYDEVTLKYRNDKHIYVKNTRRL